MPSTASFAGQFVCRNNGNPVVIVGSGMHEGVRFVSMQVTTSCMGRCPDA